MTRLRGERIPRRTDRTAGVPASVLVIILITTGISIVATYGEFAIGQLGRPFNEELGVPVATIGVLAAVMFAAGGITSIPMGWLVDRVSPRILTPIQIVLAAAAFGSFAIADSEFAVFVSCAAIGAVMTISGPLTNRIITMYVPRGALARVMGWKSIGPQAAGVLAGAAFGGFSGLIPWRMIVLGVTVIMLAFAAWATITLLRRSEYVMPASVVGAADVDVDRAPDRTRPIVWWMLPYMFFTVGAIASIAAYIPLYAIEELNLSAAVAGMAVAVIAGISVVSRFVWIRFLTPHNAVRMLILAGILATITPLVLVASPSVGPWLFWMALLLMGATVLGSTPLAQIVLVQNASPKRIGLITAWSSVASFAGLTFQPWLISVVVDSIGFSASWLALSVSGLLAALTMVLFAWLQRRRSSSV